MLCMLPKARAEFSRWLYAALRPSLANNATTRAAYLFECVREATHEAEDFGGVVTLEVPRRDSANGKPQVYEFSESDFEPVLEA